MLKFAGAVMAALLLAVPALAQKSPSFQGGKATPGDIAKIQGNGATTSAGNTLGDANGKGVNPFAILDRDGNGLCIRTDASSAAHNALCLGHDTDGNGVIDLSSLGGMGAKKLYVRINGTLYDLGAILAGGGTVTPPASGGALALNGGGCLALNGGGCLALNSP